MILKLILIAQKPLVFLSSAYIYYLLLYILLHMILDLSILLRCSCSILSTRNLPLNCNCPSLWELMRIFGCSFLWIYVYIYQIVIYIIYAYIWIHNIRFENISNLFPNPPTCKPPKQPTSSKLSTAIWSAWIQNTVQSSHKAKRCKWVLNQLITN
jgi:hypothetical protein